MCVAFAFTNNIINKLKMHDNFHHGGRIEEIDADKPAFNDPDQKITELLRCEICNVTVNSEKILLRHLGGRKHKNRAEKEGKVFECDVCEIIANSQHQLDIHLNGQKHKNKVYKLEHPENPNVRSAKGLYILLFSTLCIFINLLLLFKIICSPN